MFSLRRTYRVLSLYLGLSFARWGWGSTLLCLSGDLCTISPFTNSSATEWGNKRTDTLWHNQDKYSLLAFEGKTQLTLKEMLAEQPDIAMLQDMQEAYMYRLLPLYNSIHKGQNGSWPNFNLRPLAFKARHYPCEATSFAKMDGMPEWKVL